MSDIVEFLRARLDEDEREAKVCLDRWIEGHGSRRRWDRQLLEVEAKRRIVDRAERAGKAFDAGITPTTSGIATTMDLVLADLAAVYAEHPDYDDWWAI